LPTVDSRGYYPGLTTREYIEPMAMQGLSANNHIGQNMKVSEIAKAAIEMADELLKRLEQ